jgi:hypothetical protein
MGSTHAAKIEPKPTNITETATRIGKT